MIKLICFKSFLLFSIIFGSILIIKAQNGEPLPNGDGFAPPPRPNLLQELNLNKEQVQQLRQINRDWNPRRQQAQRRFREAQRDLDEAIYFSESNDALINQKKEAVKLAHDELINTQTTMQTLIRRVLTNDQLAKFRQLRQDFAQRQANPNRPQNPNNQNKRIGNQPINVNRPLINQRNNPPARPLQNKILRPKSRP